MFNRLENISYDWRMRWTTSTNSPVCPDLLVVAIDDFSHQTASVTYQAIWPWPRYIHGKMVRELVAEEAKVIAFDILFLTPYPEWSDEMENGLPIASDEAFARDLRRAGNVLLAASSSTNAAGGWNLELPITLLATNAAGMGHIVADVDTDGVLRRIRVYYDHPTRGRIWHLAVLAAANYLGMDMEKAEVQPGRVVLRGPQGLERVIPTDDQGYMYVDWALSKEEAERRQVVMPYAEFLQRFVSRNNGQPVEDLTVRNAIVFVGSLGTGNNIADRGATPLSNYDFIFSTHWNVANAIIQNQFIRRSSRGVEGLLILLVSLLAAAVTWRLRVRWASVLLVAVLGTYYLLGMLLFAQARYWLPMALPTTAVLLTHLSLVTYRGVVEQRERYRVKDIFSKVVAPDVVDELLSSERLGLGGSRRRVSIFFADIRGFTRLTDEGHATAERYAQEHGLSEEESEAYLDAQAREILATVNLYLGAVADTIKRHHGTFDKYIGDCAMAFWGAPTPNDRHASDCVRAAAEAQQAIYEINRARQEENVRREQTNRERAQSGHPPSPPLRLLSMGSGINTGVVTVGLMGSDQHILNYTVFGREVNLASRLEGISGRGRILISESTYEELRRTDPSLTSVCVALPPVTIKGFRESVAIYEVEWRRLLDEPERIDTALITGGSDETSTDLIEG
jgi:adenylate cyclase